MSVPSGYSLIPISWTPAMPDALYEVNVTFFGPAGSVAANPWYAVVNDASKTVNGCQIMVFDVPVTGAWFITWTVTDLSTV